MNTMTRSAFALTTVAAAGLATLPGAAGAGGVRIEQEAQRGTRVSTAAPVRWDWTMPASVTSDRPDDIAVDHPLLPVRGYPEARHVRWGPIPGNGRYAVDLTACATAVQGSARYRWRVPAIGYASQWQSTCTTRARLPEGRHRIVVSVRDDHGIRHARGRIDVKNVLMLVMGDSYSAGVGYQTLDGGKTPWLNREKTLYELDDLGCSRTRWSGFVRAAVGLERLDPRSNVTLVDVACGGAEITGSGGGLLSPQRALAYLPRRSTR